MKALVSFVTAVVVPSILAATVLSAVDLSIALLFVPAAPQWSAFIDAFALACSLSAATAVVVGGIAGVALTLGHRAASAVGLEIPPGEDFLRAGLGLAVADGGLTRRVAWPTVVIVGVFVALFAARDAVILANLTNFEWLIPAYATWVTMAAVVPVAAMRLWAIRHPNHRPLAAAVWALLAGTAYFVTATYWKAAAPYALWAAIPLVLLPAMASIFHVGQASTRWRSAAPKIVVVLLAASVLRLAFYPSRSTAHAVVHSGPVFAAGCWQLLSGLLDLDGDGATALLGGTDCDDFDYDIRPTTMELPGNGVDDNCLGGDLTAVEPAPAPAPVAAPAAGNVPSVIVITVDALRADAVGRTVAGRSVTPTIDALLAESVTFTNAYSTAASTDEAMPSLFSGMYPGDWHQHGVYFGLEPTLAEVLSGIGHESYAVLVHPWLTPPLFRGFESVDNSLGGTFRRQATTLTGRDSTRLALEQVEKAGGKPLLLWVHYIDPHMPRFPIAPFNTWLGEDTYLQAVHYVDLQIADLMAGLEARGVLDGAVVVFASDHGEGLGDHDIETHSWAVWESLVRVPVALRLPGVAPTTLDERISIVDVVPTLLDFVGVEDVTQRHGRSLMPLIRGESWEPRPIFLEAPIGYRPAHFAVIDGGLKFWIDLRSESFRLFDLDRDPGELDNLIETRPDDAERLLGVLGRWRDTVYNEQRLERKSRMWEQRSTWKPKHLVDAE